MRPALTLWIGAALLLSACYERERPPPLPPFDAGPPRDARVRVPPIPTRDGGTSDGGGADAAREDGGAPAIEIEIDGVIDPIEWEGAILAEASVSPEGVFAPTNHLRGLHARRTEDTLFLGVDAQISEGNAIVVFLDRDLGGATGLTSPTVLEDRTGALDLALSKVMFMPAELRIDFAWGTLDLARAALEDDRLGWRDVGFDPSTFGVVSAPTVCGASACETAISLEAIDALPSESFGVFARLVDADADVFSNQTLPLDPSEPDFVTTYLTIPPL